MITKIKGWNYNYSAYIEWMNELVSEKKTSGDKQSPELVEYSALNLKRMVRLNNKTELNAELSMVISQLSTKQIWYIITEIWCGDGAQNIPVLAKISEQSNGMIDLRLISRDNNPEWMEKYHTNGSKSIPKLISFDLYGNEIFSWGPRPQAAHTLLTNWRQHSEGRSWEDFEIELHSWYAKDKTITLQNEFKEILANYKDNISVKV